MRKVYLDYNAATPLRPEAALAMAPYWSDCFGNPSSRHCFGGDAADAVAKYSGLVAELLGAGPGEIIFTGGGAESNNLAIRGCSNYLQAYGRTKLITSQVEHSSVYEVFRALERERQCEVTYLGVDHAGRIDLSELAAAITPETALVSIILANNETGTVQDYAAIREIVKEYGVILHYDAVQAAGKMPLSVVASGADMMSLSAHKIYGPKGVGALYLRNGVNISPIMFGGGQQRGLRPGTLPVALIAGFGKACELASRELEEYMEHCRGLRDRLERQILETVSGAKINGSRKNRLCNTVNISFPWQYATVLAEKLDACGIAVSSGAACSAGKDEVSRALEAMKLPPQLLFGALRFAVGRDTTTADIDFTVKMLRKILSEAESGDGVSEILNID